MMHVLEAQILHVECLEVRLNVVKEEVIKVGQPISGFGRREQHIGKLGSVLGLGVCGKRQIAFHTATDDHGGHQGQQAA